MPDKKQDSGAWGFLVGSIFLGFGIGCVFMLSMRNGNQPKPCQCKPAPTPAICCKADECKQELAQVDARFGDVWDELVEVQEQLAKVKPCDCGPVKECCCEPSKPCQCDPSKSCACSDKPACECNPAEKPAVNSQVPVRRVFKRCK